MHVSCSASPFPPSSFAVLASRVLTSHASLLPSLMSCSLKESMVGFQLQPHPGPRRKNLWLFRDTPPPNPSQLTEVQCNRDRAKENLFSSFMPLAHHVCPHVTSHASSPVWVVPGGLHSQQSTSSPGPTPTQRHCP